MQQNPNSLADRVDDIEKTIGDINQVFEALKNCLPGLTLQPTCPPYCGHTKTQYPDELSLEDRVTDMKKCIGDIKDVFLSLKEKLENRAQPTCPPYCAH